MNRRTAIKVLGAGGLFVWARPVFSINDFISADDLVKASFGTDFKWGVATAAYQIEGAVDVDGRSPSIWDTFSHTEGKIKTGENGDMACDFYNRYSSDLELLKELNFGVYRFSLSWSRILPDGTGKVNEKGIEFYHNVIDKCLELGLEPWITIYHWDLPQVLEDKGGWTNREILTWFSEYAEVVTKEFGNKVKNWMVLNEPMAFTGLGYMQGVHAPGKKGFKNFFSAAHHATLCQAEGGRIIRKNVENANVGTTFSCAHIMPATDSQKDIDAAGRMDLLINRLFIEPAVGMGYPNDFIDINKHLKDYILEGDDEKVKFDFDFIGIQNYTRNLTKKSFWPPILHATALEPNKENFEITEMGWEVYPEGIYELLKKFGKYPVKKIFVTENGAAFEDNLLEGTVKDERRIEYFKNYLTNILKAKNEGVNVGGYYVWTFMDNFEWAEGYHPRFGLVYNDFTTQERTVKDSGYWFKEFLK